ncbi:MAG: O-antigen ligase family protein [Thermoleophilia bacterium]|nr:O-antigen ligase family protein [Thermoleophilia bacterium]
MNTPIHAKPLGVLIGAGDRGPIISAGVVFGSFIILALSVVSTAPLKIVAPVTLLAVVLTTGYRRLLRWESLLTGLVLVVLFIPIRRYTLPGGLPFQLEPYRVLTIFIAGGWVCSLLADPRVRLRKTGMDVQLGLIAFSMLVSDAVNGGRIQQLGVQTEVVKKLTFFASFFAIAYIVPSVVRRRSHVDKLARTIVIGGAILALCALWEGQTHYNIFNDLSRWIPVLKPDQLPYSLISIRNDRGGRLRAYGPAQSPIALGALFVMLLPFAIYMAKRTGRRLWWGATLLIFLGALATVSRTPMIMLLVLAFGYWRFRPTDVKKLWPLLVPLILVVHIALPGTLGTLKGAFFPHGGLVAEQSAGAGTYGSGRVADLGPGLHEARQHLMLGAGFGTRLTDRSEEKANAPILDDQWLGTLLETGVIGVLAWVWLFGRFYRRMMNAARAEDTPRAWLLGGLAASTLAFAVSLATYDTFSFIQVTILMFFQVGLGAAVLTARED